MPIAVLSQEYPVPILKSESRSINGFSPEGWFVSDSVSGDLNSDQLSDVVFILTKKDSVVIHDIDDFTILPRIIVLALQKDSHTYSLSAINSRLLLEYNSPPSYGDALTDITIENGLLIIAFNFDYISSNFEQFAYTFKFQQNQFGLIDGERQYVHRRTMDFEKNTYHFDKKRASVTVGTYSAGDPPKLSSKTEWFDLNVSEVKTFQTMGRPGTWEVMNRLWL